ncbi:MAG: hypothetical protein H0V49_10710 [Nocardioidaceae bacterium]|nr:hypothetical protein [Nocardioidaceae bacterium]
MSDSPVGGDARTSGSTRAAAPAASEPTAQERRSDIRFLLLAVAVCLVLRFPGFLWPLTPDEAGFLLVARNWTPEPLNPFGFYWVDRPPTLIGLYKAADMLGGSYMPRVFSAALAAVLVVAAHRTSRLIGGQSAARWATVATVALVSNPELSAWAGKGEMLAIPFVMVSCWLSLESLQRPHTWRGLALACGAGTTAVLALGMKQNLVGGLVFGAVVLASSRWSRRLSRPEALGLAGSALAGAALPIVAVGYWAARNGVHLSTLWEMNYAFRSDAFGVITQASMEAPLARAGELSWLFIETGLVAILAMFLVSLRRAALHHRSVTLAVLVMWLVDIIGVVLGGNYWTSYLIPVIPAAALSVALIAGAEGCQGRLMRVIVVVTSLLITYWLVSYTISRTIGDAGPTAYHAGLAIREVAQPDDTILPLYGRADIVEASGLRAPYRYLWSLPARTLDPQLAEMRAVLVSSEAPTWVVEWIPVNFWNIDQGGRLQTLLDTRYVDVGELCGATIWRLREAARPALPVIDCDETWLEIQTH